MVIGGWWAQSARAINDTGHDPDTGDLWRYAVMDDDLTYYFEPGEDGWPSGFQNAVIFAVDRWNDSWSGQPEFVQSIIQGNLLVQWAEDGRPEDPTAFLRSQDFGEDPHNDGFRINKCSSLYINSCVFWVNGSRTWHTGGADASAGETDARTVAMHELGHAIGLGHSDASELPIPYPDVDLKKSQKRPPMKRTLPSGEDGEHSRRGISKDDCGANLFLTRGVANCNPWVGIGDPNTNDAKYFTWKKSSGDKDKWACNDFGGTLHSSQCHQRMMAGPDRSWGNYKMFYDVEGPRRSITHWRQNTLRIDEQFYLRVSVATPTSNTGNAAFRMCMYLHDTDASSQPYKAGRECKTFTGLAAGSPYTWYEMDVPYVLPANTNRYWVLRTWITVKHEQRIAIGDYEIHRAGYEGGGGCPLCGGTT